MLLVQAAGKILSTHSLMCWMNYQPNTKNVRKMPVSTRRRFDVVTTLYGRQQRCYNVETTSCALWDVFPLLTTQEQSFSFNP